MANSFGDTDLKGELVRISGGENKLWSKYLGAEQFREVSGATAGTVAINTGSVDLPILAYDAAALEYAGTSLALPSDYDGSSLQYRLYWTSSAGTSGDCLWQLRHAVFANDETMNIAVAQIVLTDTFLAQKDLHVIAGSGIPTGATSGDQFLSVVVRRAGNDGVNDTLDGDALFLGVEVSYA